MIVLRGYISRRSLPIVKILFKTAGLLKYTTVPYILVVGDRTMAMTLAIVSHQHEPRQDQSHSARRLRRITTLLPSPVVELAV